MPNSGDCYPINSFRQALHKMFGEGSPPESRYSPPPLETRIQRAVHVRQLPLGDGAARSCSVTASTMMMIKSTAVLVKEFFQTNFTHLAVLSSTLFMVFFGVGGVKMVIDGSRERRECLRQGDKKGALMTGNRVAEGTIMIGIGLSSVVASIIYLLHELDLKNAPMWLGNTLVSLSSLTFGVYTLFEWLGSFLESRKFRSLNRELMGSIEMKEGVNTDQAIQDHYADGIAYLKGKIELSAAETEGRMEEEIIELTKAKEDLFSLYWGRELMLNVRDLKTSDSGYVSKAQAIMKEAVHWNQMRCRMVRVNFCLFTTAVAAVVLCFIVTGGLPVIGSAIVMCGLSLILNVLNTRRIFMYFQSKELGKWDEKILIGGMIFVALSMTASILLVGGGLGAVILFSVTGALILTLKGVALYKLHELRLQREKEVQKAKKAEIVIVDDEDSDSEAEFYNSRSKAILRLSALS